MVYVLGLDHLSRHEADSAYRNQLFVALTRSRGFAHVSGVGENGLFEELRQTMRMGETLTFTVIETKVFS
jgi:superfamily I DNA and RNA helicase